MNKFLRKSSALLIVALVSVANASVVPESQVSSPIEESVDQDRTSSNIGNSSWEKKRAERRQAREEILARLRQSSSQEKALVREEISKDRNQMFRKEEKSTQNQSSPRNFDKNWHHQNERRFDPGREMQTPPPPEYGDPSF